ncbi:MAG: hypothetical protein ACERKD_10230 [Prolixibacteraceae bacterium]
MENIEMSQRAELQLKIKQLKAEKTNSEEILNHSFEELTKLIFIPAPKKEKSNSKSPQNNKRAILNLSKRVLNKSTNYILEQKFGEKRPFNDFLTEMFVEFISTPFINQKIAEIFSGISDEVFDETE